MVILGNNYKAIAASYEDNFREFMKTISISEWTSTENTKSSTNILIGTKMAQQILNVSTPNSGLGDALRDASIKSNDNFTELYEGKLIK